MINFALIYYLFALSLGKTSLSLLRTKKHTSSLGKKTLNSSTCTPLIYKSNIYHNVVDTVKYFKNDRTEYVYPRTNNSVDIPSAGRFRLHRENKMFAPNVCVVK